MDYEKGDILVVTRNITGHGFEIGQKVRVDEVKMPGVYMCLPADVDVTPEEYYHSMWALSDGEVRPQLRVV